MLDRISRPVARALVTVGAALLVTAAAVAALVLIGATR